MTLFKDDDGTAYQITSAAGNADLQIWKLTPDYTAYDNLAANPWPGTFREAPALFKRGGVYFMLTSGNSGWKPNQQKYATATSITGPWTAMTDVGDDTGYGSQTTEVGRGPHHRPPRAGGDRPEARPAPGHGPQAGQRPLR